MRLKTVFGIFLFFSILSIVFAGNGDKKKKNFQRGIISSYAGMNYDKNGYPDVDEMISRLKDLGVNCYTYLIDTHSKNELAALPDFCSKAEKEGIEVWVFLVPPTEAPINKNKPKIIIEDLKYPPYDMDYLKWTENIAKISLEHSNLTLLMIDDFSSNLKFFTIDYTKKIYELIKKINPELFLGGCVYHEVLKTLVDRGYLPYLDAFLWGYQHNIKLYPDAGISAESFAGEIKEYKKYCPGKILIPCIYFTKHSSWTEDRPTKEYLEEAVKIAFKETKIVWIYATPAPKIWKYDVVKNYTGSIKLNFLKK
jgi:hypothetical protein